MRVLAGGFFFSGGLSCTAAALQLARVYFKANSIAIVILSDSCTLTLIAGSPWNDCKCGRGPLTPIQLSSRLSFPITAYLLLPRDCVVSFHVYTKFSAKLLPLQRSCAQKSRPAEVDRAKVQLQRHAARHKLTYVRSFPSACAQRVPERLGRLRTCRALLCCCSNCRPQLPHRAAAELLNKICG